MRIKKPMIRNRLSNVLILLNYVIIIRLIKQRKMLNDMIKQQSTKSEKGMDQKTMMKLAKKYGRKMRL